MFQKYTVANHKTALVCDGQTAIGLRRGVNQLDGTLYF